MYVPEHFEAPSDEAVKDLIHTHPFGCIVTSDLQASHIPFLLQEREGQVVLVGHVARANSHWQVFDGKAPALILFQGPDGYISPSWGDCEKLVPTWNYCVVHAHGVPGVIEGPRAQTLLTEMTQAREEGGDAPWRVEDLAPGMLERLLTALVVFEMPVTRFEAKWKLSQNRSEADRLAFISGVENQGNAALASAMKGEAKNS